MGAGQQQRRDQGPPSSAGNPGQQQSVPSVSQSVAGGQQTTSSVIPQVDGPNEPRQTPFGPSLGFDPARDPKKDEPKKMRCELPSYRENVSNILCFVYPSGYDVFTICVEAAATSRKYAKLRGVMIRATWVEICTTFTL